MYVLSVPKVDDINMEFHLDMYFRFEIKTFKWALLFNGPFMIVDNFGTTRE